MMSTIDKADTDIYDIIKTTFNNVYNYASKRYRIKKMDGPAG